MNFKEHLQGDSIFNEVARAAQELNMPAFVVGGYVRDLILNRPNKDIDFVCLGNGIELAQAVGARLGNLPVTIFKNFGTAMIKWQDRELEFVGARKESYRKESRKPIVENGSLEEDQQRRDFTINAMAISLSAENFGDLIDPFGGLKHLEEKIIKTPLDANLTFSDDPLRMMRAVRFASQLSFDIDADTYEAIVKNVDRLSIVSMERITTELNKIIESKLPSYGFKLLFHSGLLKKIFPEMVALHGVEYQDNKAHKDNFFHTLQVLDNVAKVSDDLWLRWAAILHDIAKPATKRFDKVVGWTFHGHEDKGARMVPGIFRRLKLPMNEKMVFVQKLVRLHLRPIALVKEVSDSAIRRLLFEAGEDADALMTLCRADITSKNNEKVARYLRNFEAVQQKMTDLEARDHIRQFQPPVSGDEIIKLFNIPPGPIIGEIKEAIKEAILEGTIRNAREEAYELMLKLAAERGLYVKEESKN